MADFIVDDIGTIDATGEEYAYQLNCRQATLYFEGTWGVGATLKVLGSHDGTNYAAVLHPAIGADGGYEILAPWPHIKVDVANWVDTTDVDITICCLNHGR